jgi:ABC-type enterochelin transport system substrate-binding protein
MNKTMNMKLNIFILSVVLLGMQACGSKSENDSDESETLNSTAATSADVEVKRAEERARLQKDIEEWEAKIRTSFL